MAAAIVSVYSSECEVVLENVKSAGKSSCQWSVTGSREEGAKGSLYGLWTHMGNVIVHLAIPATDPKEASWKEFCKEQKLRRLGSWGTREPKASDRPATLDVSVGYIYIRCSSGGDTSLACYSLPAPTSGSYGQQTLPQLTEMTVLPTASPYRSARDPKGTRKLTASGRQTGLSQKQSSSLTGHWSERPEHFGFLRELKECFNSKNLAVKQFHQSDSNTLAFQIKQEGTAFSCAIGFPPDFYKKRKVQIYGGEGGPADVILPEKATEAFDALFQSIARKYTKSGHRT